MILTSTFRFSFLALVLFFFTATLAGQSESEPNNTLATGNAVSERTSISGNVGCDSDLNDFFISDLPDDGTIRLIVTYTNQSGNGGADATSFVQDGAGNQLGFKSTFNVPVGATVTDTTTIYCRAQSRVGFRVSSIFCFDYELRYELEVPPVAADPAGNDGISSATPMEANSVQEGRIGYIRADGRDTDDYYISEMPDDGTVQLTVAYTNTSNNSGADATAFLLNADGGQLGFKTTFNVPAGETVRDTLTIFCQAQDTLYLRINSVLCFGYQIKYEVLPPSRAGDQENNNTLAEAKPIDHNRAQEGRIGYSRAGFRDIDDYYVTEMPDDGTVNLYVSYTNTGNNSGADATAFVLDAAGGQLGFKSVFNVPVGATVTDTLQIFCRARDTLHFRINSVFCFGYEIRYEVDTPPTQADPDDNEMLAGATEIGANTLTDGRIGYTRTGFRDIDDYFVSEMPDDGTINLIVSYTNTSNNGGADATAFLLNHAGTRIGFKSTFNVPIGETVADTLTVFCRAQDTIYLRVNSVFCFAYQIRYEVIPPAFTRDIEPNNTQAEAQKVSTRQPFEGRIGYTGRARDLDDYFLLNSTQLSSFSLQLNGVNHSNNAGADLTVQLRNKAGGVLRTETIFNVTPGPFERTIEFNCVEGDSLYLRFNSVSCFAYRGQLSVTAEQPTAEIEYARFGNRFAFVANARKAEEIMWDFGDMTVSDQRYPTKDFPAGVYDVTLEATNTFCNEAIITTEEITVSGIESYTPKRAGTDGGLGFFTISFFGAGLSTDSEVTLTRGGTVLRPREVKSPSLQEATAMFSIEDAQTGRYDVAITLNDGETITFTNGFEIFEDGSDFDVDITTVGPARIRNNRWTDFSIKATNERGRLANGVPVIVAIPEGVETNILDIYRTKTGRYVIKDEEWDKLTIDPDYFYEVLWDGQFDANRDSIVIDYDAITEELETYISFEVDSIFGEPFKGTAYWLYFPIVPAESSAEIRFRVRSPQTQNITIQAFALPSTVRRNPIDLCTADAAKQIALQASAVLEFLPIPGLQKVAANAGKIDIASQILFAEGFDWWYGTNVADADFYARQTPAIMGEAIGGRVPGSKRGREAAEAAASFNRQQARNISSSKVIKPALSNQRLLRNNPALREQVEREYNRLLREVESLGDAATEAQKQQAVANFYEWASKQGINLAAGEAASNIPDDDNLPSGPDKTNEPRKIDKKPIRSLTSFDPNAIYGKSGVDDAQFIRRAGSLDYTVLFENLDTAEANAQIVQIDLQLDPTKFDLSRTTLGAVTFGGNTYFLERDRNEYFVDLDLRPAENLIVRVQGKFDTLTGEANWQFTSLDPVTMDLPQGFDEGFLPPNMTSPEGEGSVSFTTYLRPEVATGDSIGAQALIFFDDNDPIFTNVWSNIIDEDLPVSRLDPTVNYVNDSTFTISYSATDATSGIEKYILRFRRNDEPWNPARVPLEEDGETQITGRPGVTYQFYITSQDRVGNDENKPQRAELTVLNGLVNTEEAASASVPLLLYPNPATGSGTYLVAPETVPGATVTVSDYQGRLHYQLTKDLFADTPASLPTATLTNGLYIVQLTSRDGTTWTQKLSVVRE